MMLSVKTKQQQKVMSKIKKLFKKQKNCNIISTINAKANFILK